MRWQKVAATLAAGVASLALLGGCSAGATPSQSPAPMDPSVSPSSPVASPSLALSHSPAPTSGPSAATASPVPAAEPTPRPTPEPTLPAGAAAPPAPTALHATWQASSCPDETGYGGIVLVHAVAAVPHCLVVDLAWVPASGTSAVFRIYESWSGEGAGAACDRVGASLIATTAPNAAAITVGPLPLATGSGALCLYVAAANSAGESTRIEFEGVSP